MYTNPYGQAGWDPSRSSGANRSNDISSIYGALPYSSIQELEDFVTFKFVEFNPNILNCLVVQEGRQTPVVQIDSKGKPGYTLFKNRMNDDMIGTIRWQPVPTVDIPGVVSKTEAGVWLELSPDGSYRGMTNGTPMQYMWIPQRNAVNLFNSSRTRLAKIDRQGNIVTLQMTNTALQAQLLEPCIVATVLFMSGNSID